MLENCVHNNKVLQKGQQYEHKYSVPAPDGVNSFIQNRFLFVQLEALNTVDLFYPCIEITPNAKTCCRKNRSVLQNLLYNGCKFTKRQRLAEVGS